jgi:hypothetical protein
MNDVRALVDRISAQLGPDADPRRVEAAAAEILAGSISADAAEGQRPMLEVRLAVSLLDATSRLFSTVRTHVYDKIRRIGSHLRPVVDRLALDHDLPTGGLEIMTTPITRAAPAASSSEFVALAEVLERAAEQCGADRISGFSADLERHLSRVGRRLIESLPDALQTGPRLLASLHCGSAFHGLNVDAIAAAAGLFPSDRDATALARRFTLACNASGRVPAGPDAAVTIRLHIESLLNAVTKSAETATAEELVEISGRAAAAWAQTATAMGKACAGTLCDRSGLDVVFDGLEIAGGGTVRHAPALRGILHRAAASSIQARADEEHIVLAFPRTATKPELVGGALGAMLPALGSLRPRFLHLYVGATAGETVDLGELLGRVTCRDAAPWVGPVSGQVPPGFFAV